jgi:transglutaminase-like putative cysteine protease
LDFIYTHISYEEEIDDVFLTPVETLGFKSGDCDDFSILAAAFFEEAGIDAAVGFFENDEREQYAMVLVHPEELTGYDYLYFSDLTGKGLEPGKWIIIEPQSLIELQSGSWIQQWNLLVAAPIEQA